MRIIAFCPKTKDKIKSNLEHLLVFKAACGDNPKQNAGTIHAFHPEHLPVLKAPCGDDPERNAGTIHGSIPEHLLVFKALRGEQSGT